MKNRTKKKIINIILGVIGIILFDILIKCICGQSFIIQIIKAL